MHNLNKPILGVISQGNDNKFLSDILTHLGNEYEIRLADYFDPKSVHSALRYANLIWVEWATDVAIHIPKNYPHIPKILRLHSYEAYTHFPAVIPWQAYTDVIFVADYIRQKVISVTPDLVKRTKTHIIPNGIDLDRFPLKQSTYPKNLAFVAILRHVKNMPFLFQCFKALIDLDPRYHLHIAGEVQATNLESSELLDYLGHMLKELGISKNTHFAGWVSDMNAWLEDKEFIVSSSIRESQGVNIIEGMSKGLKPVLHNFPAATEHYPPTWLFNTPREFAELILRGNPHPQVWREYVRDKFSIETAISQIREILRKAINNLKGCDKTTT